MPNFAEVSPVIVCGCQRSGTTAIVRILNENGVMISNEWALFTWPEWKHEYSLSQWLENKQAEIDKDEWLQHWHYRMNLSGKEARKGFTPALHAVYGNRAPWQWGDKWSDYVFHVDTIKAHFPRAKIIYIYRDGRDVVASMLRKTLAKTPQQGFERWVKSINAWRSWEKEVDHLAVKQEDLLRYPETVAANLSRYCGFDLESSAHAAYVLLGADAETEEDHVAEDPFKHTGAYHDQFSDDEIPAEAMHHLIELGYVAANNNIRRAAVHEGV